MKTLFKKKSYNIIIFILITLLICPLTYILNKSNFNSNLYVPSNGADNSIESKSHPFKTLEGARDAIRIAIENKTIHKM